MPLRAVLQQEHGVQPFVERDARALEHSSRADCELFTTTIALMPIVS